MLSSLSSSRVKSSPPHLSQTPSFTGGWNFTLKFALHCLQTRRLERRAMISSLSTSKFTTFTSRPSFSKASACGIVRGKPSRINPFLQSSFLRRSSTISRTTSSLTSPPASIIAFTFFPSSVWFLMFSRKISPVEICGILYSSATSAASVPFPAPGGPRKIKFILMFFS